MAIKFRITDTARGDMESQRNSLRRKAAWTMAAVVTGFAILLWITKVLIPPNIEPDLTIYTPPDEAEVDQPQKLKDISGGDPPPTPPITDVIVSTSTPTMDTTFTMDLSIDDMPTDSGTSSLGGDGFGDGLGSGSGNGGMGGGEKMESAFAGVFYDFKKKNDGKPSAMKDPIANTDVLSLESRFFNTRWEQSVFSLYYRAKQQLYLTCFYMPSSLDQEACHAYDPTGKMGLKPGRWAAVYRAKVQAPVSGTFRFVGIADTVMGVRFDGKNVLACGLHNLNNATWGEWTSDNDKHKEGRELYAYPSCEWWNKQMGGFVAGESFTVKQGEWYEMQVLVSEIGGGQFGFCLLLDDVSPGATKKRTKEGYPLFQLFRTAFSAPTADSAYKAIQFKEDEFRVDPPYDDDSAIWPAKPIGPDVKMK